MNIGFACLAVGVKDTDMKSCMQKNAGEARLMEITAHNLNALENIIDYNIKNNIKLFRISSDVIPFGSSPVNSLAWWDLFQLRLFEIGLKIKKNGIRVSMHPGQYTVLNSPDEGVVKRAVLDLLYHNRLLDSIGAGCECKIVLHIGGIYGDKASAIERFINNYKHLDQGVKSRLVIENDHRSYNIEDVLSIGQQLNIPVVFDNLHHQVNPPYGKQDELFWLGQCRKTWNTKDGCQKIHYSQQDPLKTLGSHSATIAADEFLRFTEELNRDDLDIMLEVKDKNLSAIKCINCTRTDKNIKYLEDEWSRYKYNVLEQSPKDYLEIRGLLKDKKQYPALEFYGLLEHAQGQPFNMGYSINALQHVWGYFKDVADVKEKEQFFRSMDQYKLGTVSLGSIKSRLKKLAEKYQRSYLLDSYYFTI